jgi:uncharacterized protein YutE (UPF0331/DUF86 family)
MYDIQRIGKIISDIKKYFKELKSYNLSKEDLSDSKNYNASSMLIFAILNRLIDLGNEIISAKNLGAPSTYQDIMPALAKANIINKEQADNMNKLIRKRNVFAHFYEDISEKELYKTIKEMGEVESFLRTIKKHIELE